MIVVAAYSILFFVTGLLTGFLFVRSFGRLLEGVDLIRLGIWALVSVPILILGGYYSISSSIGFGMFYVSVFIAGAVFLLPMYLLVATWLLWWNPKKYKEREMKELRRQRELERKSIQE